MSSLDMDEELICELEYVTMGTSQTEMLGEKK